MRKISNALTISGGLNAINSLQKMQQNYLLWR
jgi:hypothetical protein